MAGRWRDSKSARVLGRVTRGALISVGALTLAGSLSASLLSKKAAQKRLQLPEDFVLVLDFEGSDLTEKPDDPITKLKLGNINQVQLSKMVDALKHAGSDKRIQGMVGCIGDAQKHGGLAQVQELRNAVLGFRKLKQDAVPTVAYSDSFGEGGSSGTLGYYLASAFDQIYVQETGLLSFTGFAASTPFLRGLLDKWHIKPLGFAREEYKSVVSQYTDKQYSKANKEATRALLHTWMAQIVTDVAAARGMTTAQVMEALNTSPLSAPEAAAAGLLTGVNDRSEALQTLLHSPKSAADPATLVNTNQGLLVGSTAAKKIGKAIGKAKAARSESALATPDSAVQAIHSATHLSDSLALRPSAELQDSALPAQKSSGAALSLAHSPAADAELPAEISSQPQQSCEEQNADLVRRIRAAAKPLNKAVVVQITPEALDLKCCPAVPISKYIQVLEHEKQKAKQKPSIMQRIQALQAADEEDASTSVNDAPGDKSKPQVAVITATGIIVSGTSAPGLRQQKQIGSSELGRELQKARHDPKVKAVVLRVDSPGGSAVGSDAIYQEVVKVQQAGKPVVVSMGNLAASGGYYISASADKIVAQPGTITGSIGVAFGKFNASQALKDQGINVDTIAVGKNATAQSLFHDFTKEQRRQVNVLMDRTYGHFLSRVSVGRNMTLSETRKVAKGRVWTGEDALQHGLVDQLGGLADAVCLAKQQAGLSQEDDAVEVVDFPPPKSFIQLLREALSKQPQGFGMMAAAASVMGPQFGDDSILTLLLWLAMAHQPGLQSHALLPAAAAQVSGIPDIASMVTGRQSYLSHLGGLQMLHAPMHIE